MNEISNTNDTATLQGIIVEMDQYKKDRFENAGRQVIIVDRESGEILDDLPLFKFGRQFRYFELKTGKVAFDVKGPELSVPYSNSPQPFVVSVSYNAQIALRGIYNLIRSIYNASTPASGINNILKEAIELFVFGRKDFVAEYRKYEPDLEDLIIRTGEKCGLKLNPTLKINIRHDPENPPFSFINVEHKVKTKTRDAQVVEIDHYLALTLTDPIKLSLSGEKDIKEWAGRKLDQFTSNAVIDRNYAEVLINKEESMIKEPMKEACRQIGYELKQLVSTPGLEIEKFSFETATERNPEHAEYGTKDARLKIALNAIVSGRLNLYDEKTKEYIKPGLDIIAGMKKSVIDFIKQFLNGITPEECFTQQYVLEDNIVKKICSELENAYGFRELHVSIRFLENNLSRRLALLQERPKEVELISDWGERSYILWFRVWNVSKDGWYRFRLNNYTSADEELKDIARMVKSGMESAILRTDDQITGALISREFKKVCQRVREGFGLDIGLHDFTEALSKEENLHIRIRNEEVEKKLVQTKLIHEGETAQLEDYLKQRREALEFEESDEVIRKLDEKIASFRHAPASAKEKFLHQKTDHPMLVRPENTNAGELDSDTTEPQE